MKKSIILLSVLIFVLNSSKAQWNLTGNSGTSPATNFVGTTDPQDLTFRTNSTIKMQLESTGELGIGTTSPASWLHVLTTGTKESFRTDVPNGFDNYWRMLRAGTEYGRFLCFDGTTAFYMQAPRGAIRFATGNVGKIYYTCSLLNLVIT